jgi:hypothetical protein
MTVLLPTTSCSHIFLVYYVWIWILYVLDVLTILRSHVRFTTSTTRRNTDVLYLVYLRFHLLAHLLRRGECGLMLFVGPRSFCVTINMPPLLFNRQCNPNYHYFVRSWPSLVSPRSYKSHCLFDFVSELSFFPGTLVPDVLVLIIFLSKILYF